jgi:nitrile hydratase
VTVVERRMIVSSSDRPTKTIWFPPARRHLCEWGAPYERRAGTLPDGDVPLTQGEGVRDRPGSAYAPGMSRVNDVGGQSGFGPVLVEEDEPPFHADWEARVYALNVAMLRQGVYDLDQFRDAIERMPPAEYLAASYYERWLHAVETLTAGHGPVGDG